MNKYLFLYKDKKEDRDCCVYINSDPTRFECGHYFSGINLDGPCFSGCNFPDYEEIRTVLTEEEYNKLKQFDKDIHELGYGIKVGDEIYQKGIELCESIQPVYDRLLSKENGEFFEEIQEEEYEFLMNEYGMTREDVDQIFNEYLDYKDRGIVGAIYEDTYELGEEMAYCYGLMNTDNKSIMYSYFDFEEFGEDLIRNGDYIKIEDGRIVSLNY